MSRYLSPIKWLGGIAVALFIFAIAFSNLAPGMVAEGVRNSVLFHAVPFFAGFIGVLLLYILLIVLVALRFNGKIPGRTYRSVENIIVLAILFGTVCLFNPWSFVPYRYAFLMVLVAVLSFILWSHITAPRASYDAQIPPLSRNQQVLGLVAGGVVFALLMAMLISSATPKPPYGLRERVFNSYDADKQATIANEANQVFNTVEIPFLIIFTLFPSSVVYLIARELGQSEKAKNIAPDAQMAPSGAD